MSYWVTKMTQNDDAKEIDSAEDVDEIIEHDDEVEDSTEDDDDDTIEHDEKFQALILILLRFRYH